MKTPKNLRLNTQKYRKTKKGVLTNMYRHMVSRNSVDFNLIEFQNRFLDDRKFNRLYNEWVKSNHQKQFKPSLDRINSSKGYTIRNTQMLNWAENRYKAVMERRCRKGAVIQLLGNKIIKKFKSQREAVLKTGISQGCISEVLNNKRKTAGGYNWEYKNKELS